jgi:hypothetical protein
MPTPVKLRFAMRTLTAALCLLVATEVDPGFGTDRLVGARAVPSC